jgi:ArsR family transcriptional regulator
MKEIDTKNIRLFKALCNETRLKIILFLSKEEKAVCDIKKHINKSQPTTSLQLNKLEELKIVKKTRYGRSIRYKIIESKIFDLLKIAFDWEIK